MPSRLRLNLATDNLNATLTPTDIAEILSEELHPLPGTDDDQQDEMYEHFSLTVDKGQALLRIDKFLTNRMEALRATASRRLPTPDHPRQRHAGKIELQSQTARPVSIVMPYPVREIEIIPENIPLDIRYEDDDLIIVNKAAGMSYTRVHGNYSARWSTR